MAVVVVFVVVVVVVVVVVDDKSSKSFGISRGRIDTGFNAILSETIGLKKYYKKLAN